MIHFRNVPLFPKKKYGYQTIGISDFRNLVLGPTGVRRTLWTEVNSFLKVFGIEFALKHKAKQLVTNIVFGQMKKKKFAFMKF